MNHPVSKFDEQSIHSCSSSVHLHSIPISNVGTARQLDQGGSSSKSYIDLDQLAMMDMQVSNAFLIIHRQISTMNVDRVGSLLHVEIRIMPTIRTSKMPFQAVGTGFMNISEVQRLMELVMPPLKSEVETGMNGL